MKRVVRRWSDMEPPRGGRCRGEAPGFLREQAWQWVGCQVSDRQG